MGTPANKASLRNELGHKIQANNSRQDVNGDDTTDHPDVELSSLAGVKVETQPTLNAQRFLDDEIADFSSTLEGLPSELRIEILMFMPDLPTLRACVYSSPVMHEQYKSNRDRILRACLYRELDGLVIDSYALVMSRVSVLGSPRTDEKIIEFLESYKSWFSEPDTRPDMYSLTPRFVRWLAAFQLRVVRPLTRSYITWAFANLKNAVSPSMSRYMGYAADKEETAVDREPDIEINRSEVIRIQRALYRHEIFHRLFGRNAGKRYTGGFRDYFVNHVFFDMFDPWETEAIGCIDIFVREKYVDMFKQVEDDLCRLNPSLRGYVGGHPNREVPTFVVETQHVWMNATVSRGLEMTVRLLALEGHENMVAKMGRWLTTAQSIDCSARESAGWKAQCLRRSRFPTARDAAEARRDMMSFVGDAVPPNGPPIGWIHTWNGKFANVYGGFSPAPFKRWGYVFWDESRWDAFGGRELVQAEWKGKSAALAIRIKAMFQWSPLDDISTS